MTFFHPLLCFSKWVKRMVIPLLPACFKGNLTKSLLCPLCLAGICNCHPHKSRDHWRGSFTCWCYVKWLLQNDASSLWWGKLNIHVNTNPICLHADATLLKAVIKMFRIPDTALAHILSLIIPLLQVKAHRPWICTYFDICKLLFVFLDHYGHIPVLDLSQWMHT